MQMMLLFWGSAVGGATRQESRESEGLIVFYWSDDKNDWGRGLDPMMHFCFIAIKYSYAA